MILLQLFGILSGVFLIVIFFPYQWFETSKKPRRAVGIDLAHQAVLRVYSEEPYMTPRLLAKDEMAL